MWLLALLLLASCGALESAGSGVKQVAGWVGGELAELTLCPADLINCGHVYECATAAPTPSGLIEICIDDDDHPEHFDEVEELYGTCEPTPRHQGLCRVCCEGECGRGGNAYSGTYCP